jgi:hypothetical protein
MFLDGRPPHCVQSPAHPGRANAHVHSIVVQNDIRLAITMTFLSV